MTLWSASTEPTWACERTVEAAASAKAVRAPQHGGADIRVLAEVDAALGDVS